MNQNAKISNVARYVLGTPWIAWNDFSATKHVLRRSLAPTGVRRRGL